MLSTPYLLYKKAVLKSILLLIDFSTASLFLILNSYLELRIQNKNKNSE